MSNENKKTALPKLRFPEFQGEEEWEEKPLGEVCEVLNNRRKPITGSDRAKGQYPYYGASGVVDYVKDFIFDERLLLVGEDGAKWGAFENTAFIVDGKYWVNNHAHVLRPREISDTLLEKYLVQLDLAPYVTGAAPPKLTLGKLKTIPIPVSPLPAEQQKIANTLSSLDDLLTAQNAKLEVLKAHKRGLMQGLFPAEGETVPKLRFPEFQDAEEWKEKKFNDVLNIIDGDRGANYPKSNEFFDSGHCVFLNAKNVTKNGFSFNEIQFINEQKDASLRKGKLKRLDVVLTTRGSVGHFAFYSNEVPFDNIRINSGMVLLRPKTNGLSPKYLYHFCKSNLITSTIKNISFGNAQQQLTVATIKELPLNFPDVEEQQKISDCLSNLDNRITAQTQKIEALKLHKKGLMQHLFPAAAKPTA